jgi:hypothetical protein
LDEYQEAMAQLLKDQNFSELDCIADCARISKARFSGAASSATSGTQWDKDIWRTEARFSGNKFRAAH